MMKTWHQGREMITTIWKQPLATLLALTLSAIALLAIEFNHSASHNITRSSANNSPTQPKSPKETIALAKRLVGLPENAAPGLLWRTYWSRKYGYPKIETDEQMEDHRVKRDLRLIVIYDGMPDWCPHQVYIWKQLFETNVVAPLLIRRLYSMSPFCSNEELKTVMDRTQIEYDQLAQSSKTKLEYSDCLTYHIVKGLKLPNGTSCKDAWRAFNRNIHILGGTFTDEAEAKFARIADHEYAISVLRPATNTAEEELSRNYKTVVQAIQLESPDMPISQQTVFW
jgi:hypothetical protein